MNWKVIHELFEGVLGKSLLIVALATPISFLVKANVEVGLFIVSLIGALIILIGYVWAAISTPPLIKNHLNGHHYAQELFNLKDYIDKVSEFKVLQENIKRLPTGFDGYFYQQNTFSTIDNAIEDIGADKSIRALAILKFNLINEFNPNQRFSLTTIFIVGSVLVYCPLIYRVFVVLGVSG